MSTVTVQTGWLKDGQFDLSFILGITGLALALAEIGRASCRERVCLYV